MGNNELGLTHDTKPEIRLNALSYFYAGLAGTWTLCLLGGMVYLFRKRDSSPVLRLRGVSLSIAAVVLLHCYWVSVQFGYMVGPIMPGDAEFWIMSTWLPLGVALFHASNARFWHVAGAQRRYLTLSGEGDGGSTRQNINDNAVWMPWGKKKGLVARFTRMKYTAKVFVLVGAGMMFQLLVTVTTYMISRKWHSAWGIPGTEVHGETEMARKMQMGRGWEWWPSIFWQVFWAWIVAPFTLWQSRGIHDTQGWRLQTIACCVANLHAAPMWLVALYVPQMAAINQYFIPPQWIAVSIMIIEFFTIFLPCWEARRQQNLEKETLDSIEQWEAKNRYLLPSGVKSIASGTTLEVSAVTGWKPSDNPLRSSSRESLLTMGALEHVLDRNPGPLLEFSALRDFSGENISFLTSVSEWKSAFSLAPAPSCGRPVSSLPEKVVDVVIETDETTIRDRFSRALLIYAGYISSRDAEFPVNLPSAVLKKLEAVFEEPARQLYGDKRRSSDPATPFDTESLMAGRNEKVGLSDGSSETAIVGTNSSSSSVNGVQYRDGRVQYTGVIPELFSTTVFDEAEASIKYLVLTNTWPKFVKERRSSMDSVASV